jgi:PAS domain S-box-containing protein
MLMLFAESRRRTYASLLSGEFLLLPSLSLWLHGVGALTSDLKQQVSKLKQGDHICLIYETTGEQLAADVTFITDGLARGERCVFIADDRTNEEVVQALVAAGMDVVQERQRGALRLLTWQDNYLRGGEFAPQAMIDFIRQAEAEALADGFSGLRVTGEMTWALEPVSGCDRLVEYEALLNQLLTNSKSVVLCQYNHSRFEVPCIHDVFRTHPLVMLGNQLCSNPYYESPEMVLSKDQAVMTSEFMAKRVDWWIKMIVERKRAEDRLQLVIDTIPAMVFIALPDGSIEYVNQRSLQFMGLSLEDVQGWGWDVTIHPEDRARSIDLWRSAMVAGQAGENELRVRRADGIYRWTLGHFAPLRDESGEIVMWYGVSTDIDDRKQAEATVRSLLQISGKLHASLDIDELLNSLVIEAMKLIDAEIGWSGLRTEEGMVCHTHITRDLQAVPFKYSWPAGVGLPGWVLAHKLPYVMNDAQSDEMIIPEIRERFGVNSAIDTPILDAQGEVIGFFEVNNKKNGARFSESDVEKLVAVSRIASIALQNAMSYRNLERTENALRASQLQLQALSRRLLEVQEDERRHLARELHDEFGQILASITLHVHAVRGLAGSAALPRLDECATLLQQAGEQVRSLALELRPPMLDTVGLEATLRWLADQHKQRTDCQVQVVGHLSETPLSPEISIACFRVVQEALTNIVRHSSARHVWIELNQSESVLELTVRDDGVGFDVAPTQAQAARRGHLGLLGMAERVHLLGGRLRVDSKPDRGTRISAHFDLSNFADQPAERED